MKQKLIRELVSGDVILSHFIIRKKEMKQRKANGELYLTFEFGDRSGRIRGSVWDNVQEINKQIQVSNVVKVKGKVISYQNNPHITIEKIRPVLPEDHVELAQFLPTTEKDVEAMFRSIQNYIDNIKNPYLSKLLQQIFADQKIKQNFVYAPAAKLWHHNYIGGLLEHSLSLVTLCDQIQAHYAEADRDLLLTAAIIHDLGKISEFETKGFINYSTAGRLIGHITMTAQLVADKTGEIAGFPETLKCQLLHCILSHHGQKEHGSPVEPMTVEAIILNAADELDSKLAAFKRIKEKEQEPGKVWSNYVNLLDRFFYFGEDK